MKSYLQFLALIVICFFAFFHNLDAIYPDLMECRNFVTAREMVLDGNWWYTSMNQLPRLEKPPLPTWLTAISANLFGGFGNLFAMRFPSALSASLLVLFFYALCRVLSKDKQLSFIGAIVIATSMMVIQQSRVNTWDIYTHTFMIGSIWSMLLAFERKKGIFILVSALFMGLSILSKGPVSVYALWIPFIVAYGLGNKFQYLKQHWPKVLIILILGLLIGFSWNISMYLSQYEEMNQVMQQEASTWSERHIRPFYFYAGFPIYIGIWTVMLVAGFFYKFAAPRINRYGNYRFIVFWGLISLILLSVIPMKKERYLLPTIIAFCLLVTYLLHALVRVYESNKEEKWDRILFATFSITIGIAAILLAIVIPFLFEFDNYYFPIVVAMIIGILGIITLLFWRKRQIKKVIVASTSIVLLSCMGLSKKTLTLISNYPEFKGLSEIQNIKEFNQCNFYVESKIIDPRLVWQVGKSTKSIRQISLLDNDNLPLVIISFKEIQYLIGADTLNQLSIQDYGQYDIKAKKSQWRPYVYRVDKE